jgi:hypothetical protein
MGGVSPSKTPTHTGQHHLFFSPAPRPFLLHFRFASRDAMAQARDPELWRACAGPLVELPHTDERVFYFLQGHLEQVIADGLAFLSELNFLTSPKFGVLIESRFLYLLAATRAHRPGAVSRPNQDVPGAQQDPLQGRQRRAQGT